jgi:hypothetical protein
MLSNDFFCKNKDTYPPFKNGFYLEEFFLNKFNKLKPITKRKYIPCSWTNFQIEFDFPSKKEKMNTELKNWLKENPSVHGYFTIVQYDDGCLLDLPENTLVFGACSGNIPIPLIYEDTKNNLISRKINKSFQEKNILCSFVGSNTHILRSQMINFLNKDKDFLLHVNNFWTPNVDSNSQENFINTTCNSKFCLAPRGYGKSSFRFFEILQLGSIPIYIWDDVEWVPYKDIIDYSLFSISLNINNINKLKDILLSIDEKKYEQMLNEYEKIKHLFTLEGMYEWIIQKVS